jgi:divalent metal cation (Fe/Co/Zn/Cd) transporter
VGFLANHGRFFVFTNLFVAVLFQIAPFFIAWSAVRLVVSVRRGDYHEVAFCAALLAASSILLIDPFGAASWYVD